MTQTKTKTLNSRLPLKHNSDRPQTPPKRVSNNPQHFISQHQKLKQKYETSNSRLHPEDSSVWPQTWPKHVSDDPQHFMFPQKALSLGVLSTPIPI